MIRFALMLLALVVGFVATPVHADATEADAKAMVAKAIKHYAAVGQEKAFKDFSDKGGEFVKGELYVFAYSLEGTCIAHGQNQKLVGKSRIDVEDMDGKKYIQEIVQIAKAKGTGFVDYLFKNPETSKIEPKRTFFTRVAGKDVVICCGIYK